MKFRYLFLAVLLTISQVGFSQDNGETGSDDLDDLFFDSQDTQISEEQAQSIKTVEPSFLPDNKAIKFYGKFNANAGLIGGVIQKPKQELFPFATFENYLGFSAHPTSEFSIKGLLWTQFPDFEIKIDELYFDYILQDRVYITGGATRTAWGNSLIFDTNILDDEDSDVTSVFNTDHLETKRFDAILTIPIGQGQIQGLGMYNRSDFGDVDKDNLSYALSVEYPIGPFAVNLFGRTWAKTDFQKMQPAIGVQVTADLFNTHITLWGKVHNPRGSYEDISFAKFVGGLSRIWDGETWGKVGFVAEYQFIYDSRADKVEEAKTTSEVAFTVAWRHMFNSDLSPAIQWYINLDDFSGFVIPSVSFSAFTHVDVTFIAPVIYGGASYTYKSTTYTSTKIEPTMLLGLIFSLSVDY